MYHPEPTSSSESSSSLTSSSQRSANLSVNRLNAWWENTFRRASVQRKICMGYALAVGVAIVGSGVGRFVGDHYYEDQAREQLEHIHVQADLLKELHISLLEARAQEQQLALSPWDPEVFKQRHARLMAETATVEKLLTEMDAIASTQEDANLKQFLQRHELEIYSYLQQVQALLDQVEQSRVTATTLSSVQRSLVAFNQTKSSLRFDVLLEELAILTQDNRQAEATAFAALETSESLGTQLTSAILLLSVMIAVLLAIYTSRAIAHPIQAVTRVAERAAKESRFDLQAPVITDDEVGMLATSFNHLVRRINVYIQDLEIARETLERRVEERTQEISQQHHQLQQANSQLSQVLQHLQQTQAQLIQTEKMSSLGQMVAGIAHEINNPVNFIYGNLVHVHGYAQELLELVQLCQNHLSNSDLVIQERMEEIDFDFLAEDLPKVLSSMQMGADRIRQIVLSLRNFSRLDEAEIKAVDVHEGIDSTLLILNHRLKKEIEVVKQYGDLPAVECYPAQINQVFMNILNNAIDALLEQPDLPQKQIKIETAVLPASHQAAEQVVIKIWDNGPSIAPEKQEKLFDPFFTTKPVGQGTGLGLAISYQIIEKHAGHIAVKSEPNQGVEFAIALPVKSQSNSQLLETPSVGKPDPTC